MEEWKDIKNKNGYQISSEGRVKSIERTVVRSNGRKHYVKEKILSTYIDNRGYERCGIGKIHKLVAEAFVDNPNNYSVVHHKDHNKLNNKSENLEWKNETEHNQSHGGQHPCKTVHQYTITGELVSEYKSTQEASRQTNYPYGNIASACRNKNQYKGFKWSYEKM
ncbi:NUMOD4 domain-containing protein [uncultured Methanobrevibacter sp.]|uniref:NUMOD4 domain-containing protein n=1 Tax=uncultured Methanobrevibacter sp. TaxID=253161 RepID=UPI0025DF1129|nr:NUMOD4 domain-containing protein [uncultured Methanobrevibacter sp.]